MLHNFASGGKKVWLGEHQKISQSRLSKPLDTIKPMWYTLPTTVALPPTLILVTNNTTLPFVGLAGLRNSVTFRSPMLTRNPSLLISAQYFRRVSCRCTWTWRPRIFSGDTWGKGLRTPAPSSRSVSKSKMQDSTDSLLCPWN